MTNSDKLSKALRCNQEALRGGSIDCKGGGCPDWRCVWLIVWRQKFLLLPCNGTKVSGGNEGWVVKASRLPPLGGPAHTHTSDYSGKEGGGGGCETKALGSKDSHGYGTEMVQKEVKKRSTERKKRIFLFSIGSTGSILQQITQEKEKCAFVSTQNCT